MAAAPDNGSRGDGVADALIRITSPDVPIYRVFPLWRFQAALGNRQLVLASPHLWEDPNEVIGSAVAVNSRRGGRVIINQSLAPIFAQCWSAAPESDTLLRAYSRVVKDPEFSRNTRPRDEGVRVKTTPRKLLHALRAGTLGHWHGKWFVGAVEYTTQNGLLQKIADDIGRFGLRAHEAPVNRAHLHLRKHEAFSHESEVRALYVQTEPQFEGPLMRVQIEPSAVFEEVSFDPRLETFERLERESVIRSLGFTGEIREPPFYRRVLPDIWVEEP